MALPGLKRTFSKHPHVVARATRGLGYEKKNPKTHSLDKFLSVFLPPNFRFLGTGLPPLNSM